MEGLVSVVIPCFNDAEYIEQALQSVLDQTYNDKEIIIVDDGSNEATKKVLSKLESKINLLLVQDNKGPSAARNYGISCAKGKFILTLDADDYFESTFISKALEVMKANPKVGMVTCKALTFNEQGPLGQILPKGGNANDLLYRNGAIASSLIKKEAWAESGGYDEEMVEGYEDWDFNISITKIGWKIYVIDEFLFNYRVKSGSRNEIANLEHKQDLMAYIYIKHQDLFIKDYEKNIQHVFLKIKEAEREKIKIKNSIAFKVGNKILKTFNFILNKKK
ncbi:glycosyltransferase family 2 protein [Salegentibacter sp. LM13S]|uniref:glycosyltransferase family 2 protein n=1 Tax=Salegentibacter lacus TaxID=2873599 RepID=UPI001CCBF5A8|nr:glycosyltransferase family A protein [Salegentibacter lacus]MBZ9632356.1 glycosyltransferase family 2 protein [Salegentibacter lacus]